MENQIHAKTTPDLPTMTTIEGSSQIHSIGHKDGHLFIIFKNYKGELSRPYRYAPLAGAPSHEHHHTQIQSAESAGRYVRQHIKDGGYAYEKL